MTSRPDTASSSGGAAAPCRGAIQLTQATITMHARSRQGPSRCGADGLPWGVARATGRRCGETLGVKIPYQDCHWVRCIDVLLSYTLPLHGPSDLVVLRSAMYAGPPEPLSFPEASCQSRGPNAAYLDAWRTVWYKTGNGYDLL